MAFETLNELSRLETDYVYVPVLARDVLSGALTNPTGDTVAMTFTIGERLPDAPTWYQADWITDEDGKFWARCLVGPDGGELALAASPTWWPTVKIGDNPTTPMIRAARPFRVR